MDINANPALNALGVLAAKHDEINQYLMQKLLADMTQALKDYNERPFYEKDEWWG